MQEKAVQNQIRVALSKHAIVFRINVGCFLSKDGRRITTGVPIGFSDLFGFRFSDGKAFFIECKSVSGKIRPEQHHFIDTMRKQGALAGIARSVEEALNIING